MELSENAEFAISPFAGMDNPYANQKPARTKTILRIKESVGGLRLRPESVTPIHPSGKSEVAYQ